MKQRRFRAEVEMGHKGAAVIVPFDPAKAWGTAPKKVLGEAIGHLVRGTVNGAPFEGFIGHRWGRFFILTDDALLRAAGAKPEDVVEVVVTPREGGALPKPPRRTPKARRGPRGR